MRQNPEGIRGVPRAIQRRSTGLSTEHEQPILTAVVLAAGRGTRMGRGKAGLPWGGQTLLEAWVRRFVGCGCTTVAAVVGGDSALLRAQVDPSLPIAWAVNDDPAGSGPRESLLLGLDALPADSLTLFTPVDVPVVQQSTILRLIDAWNAAETQPLAVLPRIGDRTGHPVLAGADFVQRLYEGERGDRIDAFLGWAQRRLVHVDVEDERVLANMNAPADYAGWAPTQG
jgi:CTP:molybdopterin cytidylyltransferase MocA